MDTARQTEERAAKLLKEARKARTAKEHAREKRLARMMADPLGKAFLTAMTDQCFRSKSEERTTDQLVYLLERFGEPSFLSSWERAKLQALRLFGKTFPHFFATQIRKQVRQEMAPVMLLGPPEPFIRKSRDKGVIVNLNRLGEMILGEEEAKQRLELYLKDLAHPDITHISVKISTLYSQIHLLAWEETLAVLADRLRQLYRAAKPDKLVTLDMEAYDDLELTVALFEKVLSEKEMKDVTAGIVLQSYLPDSFTYQKRLTEWALKRGGAPIYLRIVKGANLSMETVIASQRGWTLAPYSTKEETDAHTKQMVEYALKPEHLKAVRVGIGSHNLFDIAFAMNLGGAQFEMLKGMAPAMARSVHKNSGSMLLYSPHVNEKNFHHAVAYLTRRFEENTAPENFLSDLFDLAPESKAWQTQAARFRASCLGTPSSAPRRQQDRRHPEEEPRPFHNEPDTDLSLAHNRTWATELYTPRNYPDIPLVISGKSLMMQLTEGSDPSCPDAPLYRYSQADEAAAKQALSSAQLFSGSLASLPNVLRRARGELIAAMIADGGKTFIEADTEISEAIDFVTYYQESWNTFQEFAWTPLGTVLVAPPWNFPCSIPVGGIAAALIAGNAVIFKPAPEAVLIGWILVNAFWDAGVPKESLQFLCCPDEPVGTTLVQNVDAAILTGATATARYFLKQHPRLHLMAETGGKNALIVSALCDRDQAIHDLVHSAFGHAGQKCSACSLAILEAELYDDPDFLRQLKDAAASLPVGPAWERQTRIPTLIRPAEGALLRGLTTLEPGEAWLLEPTKRGPQLWTPGIKTGVTEGNFTHQTELFGPVLGLMRASNLDHALTLANGTPYGLTSGLHSLDEREHRIWRERIEAGNLYINRTITGAIVRRQPFGGCKASGFGPGAKAGGPHYITQLAKPAEKAPPTEKAPLPESMIPLLRNTHTLSQEDLHLWKQSCESYAYWAKRLQQPTDVSQIVGQDNIFYLIPRKHITIHISGMSLLDRLRVEAACTICSTPYEINEEDANAFEARVRAGRVDRVRCLNPPDSLLAAAAEAGIFIASAPVFASGRLELLHYLREVALSYDFHRYGLHDRPLPATLF